MEFNKDNIVNIIMQLDKVTINILLKIYKLKYIIDGENDNLIIKTLTDDQILVTLPDVIKAKSPINLVSKIIKESVNKYLELKAKGSMKQLNTLVSTLTCNSGISIQLVK